MAGLPPEKKPVMRAEIIPPLRPEIVPVQLPAGAPPTATELRIARPPTTNYVTPRAVARGGLPTAPPASVVARPTSNGTIGEGLAGGIGAVDRATIDADKANMAAYQASLPQGEVGQVPMPAAAVAAPSTVIPGERGNYNQANTSTVDAAGNITSTIGAGSKNPVSYVGAQSGGGGLGMYGGQSAADYLASKKAEDRTRQKERQYSGEILQASQQASKAFGINGPRTQGDRLNYRHAQETIAGLTNARQAGINAENDIQKSAARDAAALEAADLSGQYGLANAQITSNASSSTAEANLTKQLLVNQGTERVAMINGEAKLQAGAGTQALRLQQAQLAQTQLAAAQSAADSGDTVTAHALLIGVLPPNYKVVAGPDGMPAYKQGPNGEIVYFTDREKLALETGTSSGLPPQ